MFGWLSDRIGPKAVVVTGLAGAALLFHPLFAAVVFLANPGMAGAGPGPIVVTAPADTCSFQFNPTGAARFTSACDTARGHLARLGLGYRLDPVGAGEPVTIRLGDTRLGAAGPDLRARLDQALAASGSTRESAVIRVRHLFDILSARTLSLIGVLAILGLFGAMVYAPMAAYLVELMPRETRTTALSLPYNIGNGWIGGLLPATAFALVVQTGNPLAGVWYPVAFATLSAIVATLCLPETRRRPLD